MPEFPFTPEEIQQLVAAGKITWGDMPKIPEGPAREAAVSAFLRHEMSQLPMIMPGPLGASAPAITGAMGLLKESGKALIPTGVQIAASAAGHPWIGMGAAHGLSRLLSGRGGHPLAPSSPPAQLSSTGYSAGSSVAPMGGFSSGPSTTGPSARPSLPPSAPALPDFSPQRFPLPAAHAPTLPRFGGEPAPEPKNVTRTPATGASGLGNIDEVREQVRRGIQHDFRGRVTFDRSGSKPAPRKELPPGATRKTPPKQFKSLLDDYAEAQGDPREVEALRAYISKLLSAK